MLRRLNLLIKILPFYSKPLKYVLSYYNFIKNPRFIELKTGEKFVVNDFKGDFSAIKEIYVFDEYKLNNLKLDKNPTIIDIGANIGVFSIRVAKRYSESRIFSYEPLDKTFKVLEDNIVLNNLNNTKAFNLAISDKRGKIKFHINKKNLGASSIIKKSGDQIEVKSITLNDIFKINKISRCDLLKLDCEGAEFYIIYSTNKSNLKRIQRIVMEYHAYKDLEEITRLISFLRTNGFECFKTHINKEGSLGYIYARRMPFTNKV